MENLNHNENLRLLGEKASKYLRGNLAAKLAIVTLLIVILLAPLSMIQEQISARQGRQKEVATEISEAFSGTQVLTGPVLVISTPSTEKESSERIIIPAEMLDIQGRSRIEQRYRGIYKVMLYNFDLNIKGHFDLPADLIASKSDGEPIEKQAVLLFSVSDLRGIGNAPQVTVNGQSMRLTVANERFGYILKGKQLGIDLGKLSPGQTNRFEFSFPLNISGTERFSIVPSANNNSIQLQADWAHPKLSGHFLPKQRKINDNGFDAQWEISNFGGKVNTEHELSVDFIEPVDIYLQSERAVKYGCLFIVMTFAAMVLGEVLRRRPVHIVQYLLVGLALTIFFLLLIALSEHLPFLYAYLASAVACIGLIVFYLAGVFQSKRQASVFGAGLNCLYGVLYIILQMEDKALVAGSLVLFAALTAIMLSTRHFNWYVSRQDDKAPVSDETHNDVACPAGE